MDVCQYAHKEEAYIQRQLDKIDYNLKYCAASPKFGISKIVFPPNCPYKEENVPAPEEYDSRVIKDGVDVETFKAALEKIETAPEDFLALFEKEIYEQGVLY